MLAPSHLWTILKNVINKISWQKIGFNNRVICAPMEEFPN